MGAPSLPNWTSGISIANRGPPSGIRAACCTSVVLFCVGIGLVLASVGNDRQVRVQTYDNVVHEWANFGREEFEGSAFIATVQEMVNGTDDDMSDSPIDTNSTNGANVTNGTNQTNQTAENAAHNQTAENAEHQPWLPGSMAFQLEANSEMDWSFSDDEGGEGLESFEALKFEAEVEFPSYYPDISENSTEHWTPLPGRLDAPAVRVSFVARTPDGRESAFATHPVPLFYEERVLPRTPAPDTKCRTVQKGIWRHGSCYVVKHLTHICVQLELDDETGAWQLKRMGENEEGYGCDPMRHWSYSTYAIDTCWGHGRFSVCSPGGPRPQRVEVTVRSWRDPKLTAADLTRDKFNFGTAASTQLALGAVLLVLGALLAMPPILGAFVPYARACYRDARSRRLREQQLEALSPAARRVGSGDSSA